MGRPLTAAAVGPGLQTPLDPMASVGSGVLKGAAAMSASNAWAVGSTGTGKVLIERRNGRTSAHRLFSLDGRNRKERLK